MYTGTYVQRPGACWAQRSTMLSMVLSPTLLCMYRSTRSPLSHLLAPFGNDEENFLGYLLVHFP